jgi:hypothetical protein
MRSALASLGARLLPLWLCLAGAAGPSCGARTSLDTPPLEVDVEPAVPCKPGLFTLHKARPTLLLVIDRSRSMLTSIAGGDTRWSVLRAALASALPPVDESMDIGALLFPAPGTASSMACTASASANLLPGPRHVGQLLTLLAENPPSGSTPTADAIAAASQSLLRVRAGSAARALVLATDGAPDCNESLNRDTCTCVGDTRPCPVLRCLDDERTVSRIAAAAAQGLPTYVIGIHDGVTSTFSAVLDAMADAGQRAQPKQIHRYYAATSQAELDAAFVTIRDQVGACSYLTSSVPDRDGSMRVTLNGRELVFDSNGMVGWNWTDQRNGELVLSAADCAEANLSGSEARAELACALSGTGGRP